MADEKKRLGRGLDSLLSSTRLSELNDIALPEQNDTQPAVIAKVTSPRVAELPLDKIQRNPHQPRQKWDEERLLDLADSIKANGLIQPILVRPLADGYQLIAGERRLRAAMLAQQKTIPAIIRHATEEQMVEWSLVENIHRTDLNSLERANAYQHYIKTFNLTQQDAAQRLGEDRATIANYIRLLELPSEIKTMISDGLLSMGHARALLAVLPAGRRLELAKEVIVRKLSVRQLERRIQEPGPAASPAQPEKNAHIQELQQEMSRVLGTKVIIQTQGKKSQRGRIIIEFYSLDDFDRIKEKLQ